MIMVTSYLTVAGMQFKFCNRCRGLVSRELEAVTVEVKISFLGSVGTRVKLGEESFERDETRCGT